MKLKIDFLSLFKKGLPFVAVVVASLLAAYISFLPGMAFGDDIAFHISMTNDLLYGFEHGYFGYSTNHLFMGGFALFNYAFYGPALHYGAAIFVTLFKWAGATPTVGLEFMILSSGALGGIFMYLLALKISKNNIPVALISAVLFVVLPYRLFCALARCAIAESVAMALMPMVFYGAYSFVHDEEWRVHPYVAFTVGASLIVLSHAFTGLITAMFGVLYMLFNIKTIYNRRHNFIGWISLGSAALLTAFCVLFYVLNAFYYESADLYNVSDPIKQWTNYDHVSWETSRSYDFSGFLNLPWIREQNGRSTWDQETVSSLLFSALLYFVSMFIAVLVDFATKKLPYSKFYRHAIVVGCALALPLVFRVRAEIYIALFISLVLYFFISFMTKVLPEQNEENDKLYKEADFYFLTISIVVCLILLFVPESWKFVPHIMYQGQFAWRMWSITAFLFAMLVALLLSKVKFNRTALITSSIMVCSIITFSMAILEKRVLYTVNQGAVVYNDGYDYPKGMTSSGAQNEMVPAVFDHDNGYVSKYANSLHDEISNRLYYRFGFFFDKENYLSPAFLEGDGTIQITEYNSPNNKFHVNITSDTALIQFPQFYYANYSVYSNGKNLGTAKNVDGLIAFDLKGGEYDIKLSFKPSTGYQLARPLFYIGIVSIIGGGIFGYIYRKKIMKPKVEEDAN